MINISALLDEIKASPYREIVIRTPHTGVVTFADIKEGDEVLGPQGQWKEKPGTRLATLERERNPKPICSPEKGIISKIHSQLEGMFVEAGTPLMVIRHMLTRSEVNTRSSRRPCTCSARPSGPSITSPPRWTRRSAPRTPTPWWCATAWSCSSCRA